MEDKVSMNVGQDGDLDGCCFHYIVRGYFIRSFCVGFVAILVCSECLS